MSEAPMSDVVIAGIGQTPVGEHWELSLRTLAVRAIQAARQDAGGLRPQAMYVGNFLASMISHQANLGALLAEWSGLEGIEAYTLESAGASGGSAFRQGYLAVASGLVDVALVVGWKNIMTPSARSWKPPWHRPGTTTTRWCRA